MLLTLGLESFIKMTAIFARASELPPPMSEREFNSVFFMHASKRYPGLTTRHEFGEPTFVEDIDDIGLLAASYDNDSVLDDLEQSKVMAKEEREIDYVVLDKVRNVVATFVDNSVYRLPFRACVNYIFCRRSGVARGGSTSELPGVMWVNPKPHWQQQDIIELLIHELTHSMLFFDEMIYGHYHYDRIPDRNNWAMSSILRIRRPLDKVVHSILVGSELICLRQKLPGFQQTSFAHGPTEFVRRNVLASINDILSMENIIDILHPRSLELVMTCRNLISTEIREEAVVE